MSGPRSFFDEQYKTNLLLPDLLSIKEISTNVEEGDVIVALDASMTIDESWKNGFPAARPVVLENPFFMLRKPESLVTDFQFIQTPLLLEGKCIITVPKNKLQELKTRLATDVSFLKPEYSGTSEVFLSSIEVAKAHFPIDFIERLRLSNSLSKQLFKIIKFLESLSFSTDQAFTLTDLLIQRFGSVSQIDAKWQIIMPPGEKDVSLVELKTTKRKVNGDISSITVKLT